MKKIIILPLFALPLFTIAQKPKTKKANTVASAQAHAGVNFIHKVTNWNDVLKVAKKEDKYIFVDCYTTWCGPCKYVSSKVFPLQNVGDFYNKHFVNVKLQIDETAKDNADVIATRSVAKEVENKYSISAYPTFLVFDKTGKLVHKIVGAGDDKMFLEKGNQSINPKYQYYTLVDEYNNGNTDGEFLTRLIKASSDASEKAEPYLGKFIETRKELYTKENADLIMSNTETTGGIGFKILYEQKEKWLKVVEKKDYDKTIKDAIENEIGEMVAAFKNNEPDWNNISASIKSKYPEYADETIIKAQVMSSLTRNNWKLFEEKMKVVVDKYPNMFSNIGEYNALAWGIFENISNKELLQQALIWSKKSIDEAPKETAFLDTYANILYKLGKKDEAIDYETKAMNLANDAKEKQDFAEVIAKMKKGQMTWKN